MSEQVTVSLHPNQNELWQMFHVEVNEMIVTKAGRNFFPKLEYIVKGLDSHKYYAMMIQMQLADDFRYKFTNGQWMQSGRAESQKEYKKSWHADGVQTGKEWMNTVVCFERVKITNDMKATNACMIPLLSMHKYIPVLTIYEAPSQNPFIATSSHQPVSVARIPHTEFVAVTAYQNQRVIDMKIQFNAYAKGFRKERSDNRKRRAPSVLDYSTDESNSKSSSPQPDSFRTGSLSPPDLSPFSNFSSPINPFIFPFALPPLNPPGSIPNFPFSLPFFPSFNPLAIPITSEKVKEEPTESEEDIDIIH